MTTLEVTRITADDVLQDIVRLNTSYRPGIRAGQLCRVRTNSNSVVAVARNAPADNKIGLDLHLRTELGVRPGETTRFDIDKVGWWRELAWVWHATDPVQRTAGRLGILSLFLGCLGAGLGAWSLVLAVQTSAP